MNDFDWKSIVERAINGDKTAFEMLYKKTERSVYFTCIKLLGNEHDVQDIMQETYIKAFERLSDLKDYAKFQSWINRIAVNNCKMFFRKPVSESIDDRFENGIDIVDENGFNEEDFLSNFERRRIIMEIIDTKLSDVQRQTIILYYYVGMNVSEIAATMDCSYDTVKYRLNAAREKIKEVVLLYEKESDDKLFAVVPIFLLPAILGRAAEEVSVPAMQMRILQAVFTASYQGSGHINASSAITGGSKKMLKTLRGKIVAGTAAVLITGGAITAGVMLNSNSGDNGTIHETTANGNTEGDMTEFTKLPGYEKIAGSLSDISLLSGATYRADNYGYEQTNYVVTNLSTSGVVKWGTYYNPQDYKIFVSYMTREELNFAYTKSYYIFSSISNTSPVTEPYNDKNIMFISGDKNYHIEIPETGDVTRAFLAADETTLICISKNTVRGFSTENGSKLWEVPVDSGAYFATYQGFSTDKKKLIVDMYTADPDKDGKYNYYDSLIINLTDGSSKKIAFSGLVSDAWEHRVENEKITAEWEICQDKYLGIVGVGRHGEDLWLVVDDNGEILLSTDIIEGSVLPIRDSDNWKEDVYIKDAYVLGTGQFVFFATGYQDDRSVMFCTVLDNDLSLLKEYIPTYLNSQLTSDFLLDRSQTIFAGENAYGFTGSTNLANSADVTHLAFDKDGNLISGFNLDVFGYNAYMFGSYKIVPEGTESSSDRIDGVINLYTGKTLEGYTLSKERTFLLKSGMSFQQGDAACLVKDYMYSFFDPDFNLIHEVQEKAYVADWANYEGSDYLAYVTGKGAVFAVNKLTKETVQIKDSDTEAATNGYGIIVNGDFILYTAEKQSQLHAYNIKTGKDNVIFTAENPEDYIYLMRDKRQNNVFVVYRGEDSENIQYDIYLLK